MFEFKWSVKDTKYLLFFALLVIIFFFDVLFLKKTFYYRDVILQFHPYNIFALKSIKNLELPFWNPYSGCGCPFIANMQSAFFYPFKVIIYLFDFYAGYNIFIAVHIFFAGFGMYLLSKLHTNSENAGLLSAVCFSFSAFTVARIEFLSVLSSLIWLPFIIFFFEQYFRNYKIKFLIFSALCMFMQILGGHPQIAFYSGLFLIIFGVFRAYHAVDKKIGLMRFFLIFISPLIVILTASLLSMFQLLPFAEFVKFSERTSMTYFGATAWSLNFENLFTIFNPFFLGSPADGRYWGSVQFWSSAFYFGIIAFIFAIFSLRMKKNIIFFFVFLVITVILALGKNTPVYKYFFVFVPGFKMIRNPSTIMFLFVFISSLLAGYGFKRTIDIIKNNGPKTALKYGLVVLILISAIAIIFINSQNSDIDRLSIKQSEICKRITESLTYVLIFLVVFYLAINKSIKKRVYVVSVISLLSIDLMYTGFLITPRTGLDLYLKKTKIMEFLEKDKEYFRIIGSPFANKLFNDKYYDERDRDGGILGTNYLIEVKDLLHSNINMSCGIYSVSGYDPVKIDDYKAFEKSFYNNLYFPPPDNKFIDVLNVKYLLMFESLKSKDYEYISASNNIKLYRKKNYYPRAIIAEKPVYCANKSAAFEKLAEIEPLNEIVLIEDSDKIPAEQSAIPSKKHEKQKIKTKRNIPEIVKYTGSEIIINVNSGKHCYLTVSDNYYPGWNVSVDGKKRECLRANYSFKAVELFKGDKVVKFYYICKPFYIGLAVSIAAFLIIVFFVFNAGKKN